jgi:predicted DNA-binding transcriptional regulator AlpA
MSLLTRPDLREKKGIPFSNQWLHELERAGKFPRRSYIGALTPVWDEAEIDRWLAARPTNYSDIKPIKSKARESAAPEAA